MGSERTSLFFLLVQKFFVFLRFLYFGWRNGKASGLGGEGGIGLELFSISAVFLLLFLKLYGWKRSIKVPKLGKEEYLLISDYKSIECKVEITKYESFVLYFWDFCCCPIVRSKAILCSLIIIICVLVFL